MTQTNIKRWFCGFLSGTPCPTKAFPTPYQGKRIWDGESSLYVCGNWKIPQLIIISEDSTKLVIVGSFLASHQTLAQLFKRAVRNKEYSQLMRLPGSYNLIIQDKTDTYVFVDLAGLRPVFYSVYGSLIVYSSLGVALQQLIKADVDINWIATHLMGFRRPYSAQNRSPFCKIQAIPNGHYLQISAMKLTCKRYWSEPQKYSSLSETTEELREQLLTAVNGRVRLYGNITSDLSGGFDSTSLALIAAKSLAEKHQKLHAVTLKSIPAAESEDLQWAQHAANLYSNISHVMVEAHEIPAEYSNLEKIPLTDAPDPVVLAIGEIGYVMEILRLKGSQLHMSGEGGDAVLLSPYSYLADLLKHSRIGTFIQHTYGWSRVKRLSPVPLIIRAAGLSFTSYRNWLLQQARKLINGKLLYQPLLDQPLLNQLLGWDTVLGTVHWYTDKAVDLVVEELQKWAAVSTPFANSPGQHESVAVIHLNGFTARIEQQLAETYDINLEFPYLDSPVIDICLRTRPEDRTNPFMYKQLLSRALYHDLPKSVFKRTTKGDYIGSGFTGLRQNLAVVEELFQTSYLAQMSLIDLKEFRSAMKQFNMGLDAGFWHFSQTVAIELWLHRLIEQSDRFWL